MKPKKSIYVQRQDGEGFTIPNKTVYKLACCDCGLVHKLVIFAEGRKGKAIGVAASRDNRATGQRRRQKKVRIVLGRVCEEGGWISGPPESGGTRGGAGWSRKMGHKPAVSRFLP